MWELVQFIKAIGFLALCFLGYIALGYIANFMRGDHGHYENGVWKK